MTPLEKYAYNEALKELVDAMDRLHESKSQHLEHNRIFIRGNVERAINAIKAITDQSKGGNP